MIDLQWFAAEDEGRTEDPTEETYRKAKEEGRVAKSQELVSGLVLLFPAIVILIMGPYILQTCTEMLRFFITRAAEIDAVKDRFTAGLFFQYYLQLITPIAAVSVLAAIVANIVQTGFFYTAKPLVPDFKKVLPQVGRYFQRTLFSPTGVFNFFKSIIKIGIIGAVAYVLIRGEIERLVNLQTANLWFGVTTVATLAAKMLIISAILIIILAIPDFLFQRWQFKESLKMTVQQAKEERKQFEGDPYIRSRLRQRMRELSTRNMLREVPKADVVITNPTHYAVALEYFSHRGQWETPMLTAKGEDEIAMKIRRVAEQHDVPIIENRPLARELFANVEVGDLIPESYVAAVAIIYTKVVAMNEERRKEKVDT
ncbi:flagellar biosynthesis protein FlhB [Breznakiellaceae bacterium SP9]